MLDTVESATDTLDARRADIYKKGPFVATTTTPQHEQTTGNAQPVQNLSVYPAQAFRVTDGANQGDAIGPSDELELADTYMLAANTHRLRLALQINDETLSIGQGSEVGRDGARLHLDCAATFMTLDGSTLEALIIVETDDSDNIAACYMLPFAPLDEKQTYSLVNIDRQSPRTRLAEIACVAFTRGTHITMANGKQVLIEDLNVGDRVLTRDHGAREIRWIGQQTMRATGAFAPITIKEGVLNNAADLVVSPNHRIFIYQRNDRIKAGRAEVLVKARLLVNGVDVVQSDGGFVDYFQVLFDQHEIIYAEGIAAESMFVDKQAKTYLPSEVHAHLSGHAMSGERPRAIDITDGMLDSANAVELLRAASRG